MPAHGSVAEAVIPGVRSGFLARPGWVYVPPAYLTGNPPLLPVLVLIGGQPGDSKDWQNGGAVADKMDAWANAHGGLAPVVVMPDALGGQFDNPLCMDSALGRSDTYLTQDLVVWMAGSMKVNPDHAHWAVGGYSFGGTCALQLAVAHRDLFATFFDVSGQESPTLGSRARTVQATFGGDVAAFAKVDPLQELASGQYTATAGYVAVGAQDSMYRPQAATVAAAARKAGMTITYKEFPGRHDWSVWGPAFADAIPWLATRMGLPG
jgi:S-formylglutathione hydrolase FrmB